MKYSIPFRNYYPIEDILTDMGIDYHYIHGEPIGTLYIIANLTEEYLTAIQLRLPFKLEYRQIITSYL